MMSSIRRGIAAMVLLAGPALGATVNIEKIVRTGDAVPGRPFASVQFRGRASQLPGTINDSGVVAFQAHSENPQLQNDAILGTRQGIYVKVPGNPLKVVADTTLTPTLAGTFAVPGHPNAKFDLMSTAPLLNNNGDIVFSARYNDPVLGGKFGLFSTTINGTTTSIVKIADTTDVVPGYSVPFTSFTSGSVGIIGLTLASLNDNGNLVFYATFDSNAKQGLFGASVSGGPIVRLADSGGTFVPSGQSQGINFIDIPTAINNAGRVVFFGRVVGSSRGVFSAPVTGGSITTVAFQFQTAPGTTFKFGPIFTGPDVNEFGKVAFNNQLDTNSAAFDQGDYVGDVNGGPRTVAIDTLGGFAVPGRPPAAAFDRISHAAINESGRMGPFARIMNSGVSNDQGVYLADALGIPIVRIIDRDAVPPGLGAPAKLQFFDPNIEGGSLTVAGGGSAAIDEVGNLVMTGTGLTATGGSLRGIYYYDQCASELVRIADSTTSPMAPPAGLGGTFSGGVQALFGFQNSESRSGYYRTINDDNDVTFLGRFTGLDFGIYVAHITAGSSGQLAITCPPDVMAECPANTDPSATGAATASGCGDITVSYVDVVTPGCGGTENITRTWTADNGSTTAACMQTITETDTTAPVLSGVPDKASAECGAVPPPADVTANDACQGNLPVSLSETSSEGPCPGTYMLTRTWTATDGCGNSSEASHQICVIDSTDPTLMGTPGDATAECDAVPPADTPTSSDSCDTMPTIAFSETRNDGTCPDEYTLTRTWTATDDCGNDVSSTQVVSVDDTMPPTITCPPHATLECPADTSVPANGSATASDNCATPTVTSSDAVAPGCGATQTTTRTWTATDDCGNSASCDQFVAVVDTTAPTIVVNTTPIIVTDADCSGAECVLLPVAAAVDGCDAEVSVGNDAPGCAPGGMPMNGHDDDDGGNPPFPCAGSCFPTGQTTVMFTATDDCGNTVTATVPVTVLAGASIHIQADRHTVESGSHPGSSKTPLVGIDVCAYDKSDGSCPRIVCGGISHQHYQCILDNCSPVNCCTTDATGECTINLPPGDYIVVSGDATKTVLPDPLGVSASDLECGDTMQKHLQQIVRADGSKKPGKTTRLTGSELLIIEPEFVVWDDTVQLYPFVFETIGDWTVTATVVPPEGFVADHEALTAEVANEIESVQFTITELGSDLVPTQTEFRTVHNGKVRTVRSKVDLLLTPEYAQSRGFSVEHLRTQGLIVESVERIGAAKPTRRPSGR